MLIVEIIGDNEIKCHPQYRLTVKIIGYDEINRLNALYACFINAFYLFFKCLLHIIKDH